MAQPSSKRIVTESALATFRTEQNATIAEATTGPQALVASRKPIAIYGHSYTMNPGYKCTPGQEFYNILAGRLNTTVQTAGVGSSRAVEVARDVTGNRAGPALTQLYLCDTEANDFAHYVDGTNYNPMSAQQAIQFGWSVAAVLALLGASSRVEAAAGTVTGTGWTRGAYLPNNAASEGFYDSTNIQGDYADIPVTITASDSGVVYLMAIAHGAVTSSDTEIYVDGVLNQTVTYPVGNGWENCQSGRSGLIVSGWRPTRIEGLTVGAHTIRVKCASASAYLFIDCVLIQSAAPPVIVYYRDQPPVAGRGGITPAMVSTWADNKALCDVQTAPVFAKFRNVKIIDHAEYLDASSVDTADGLHPNDKGMARIAEATRRALATLGQNADYM